MNGLMDELGEGTHRTGSELIETLGQSHIFGSVTKNIDVVELQRAHLVVEPLDSTLHRLDEREVHVWSGDRQDEAWKPRATADVSDGALTKQGSHKSAVEYVPGPQSGEFQGADEPVLLAVGGKRVRELSREFDAFADQIDGNRRLDLGVLRNTHSTDQAQAYGGVVVQPRLMTVCRSRPSPSEADTSPRSATMS